MGQLHLDVKWDKRAETRLGSSKSGRATYGRFLTEGGVARPL
jgi:hypothetical protein